MRTLKKALFIPLFCVAGLELASVSLLASSSSSLSPCPFPDQVIRLGFAGPLTGPSAVFGEQSKIGVTQAVHDVNEKGGVLNCPIKIIPGGDDMGDPKQAVSVANYFVNNGAQVVIGHWNSGNAIPASKIYEENNILYIAENASSPMITDRGLWNTHRVSGRDDQQGEIAADYIVNMFAQKDRARIMIVHDGSAYGRGLAMETKKSLLKGDSRFTEDHRCNDDKVKTKSREKGNKSAKSRQIYCEVIRPGNRDFSALIAKVKAMNIDLLYFAGVHTEGGLIIRKMRDERLKTLYFSGDTMMTREFPLVAGPGVGGALATLPRDPRTRPESVETIKKLEAKGYSTETLAIHGYAAVQVFTQATAELQKDLDAGELSKAESLPKKIAEVMKSGKCFDTVVGKLAYDQKGDIKQPSFAVYEWKPKKDAKGQLIKDKGNHTIFDFEMIFAPKQKQEICL